MKTVTFDETKWRLVPVKSTEEMIDKAWGYQHPGSVWELMLSAAPHHPTTEKY